MQQKLIINAKKLQKQKYRNTKTQNAEKKKTIKKYTVGCHHIYMLFLSLWYWKISQRFFDKFEKSKNGMINQEEFMKALAEERNLVDILTQNGRCYQGIDLWKDPDFVSILKIILNPRLLL